MKNPSLGFVALLCSILMAACASISNPDTTSGTTGLEPPTDVYYIVERGDLLSGIAAELTGDAENWTQIASANNITDPRKLQAGQEIRIPTELYNAEVASKPVETTNIRTSTGAPLKKASANVIVKPDIASVQLSSANPNKRFELKPLNSGTAAQVSLADESEYVRIIGSYFPKVVYQSPQLDAKLLMRVAPGTTFPLERLDNGWYRISTAQGSGFLRMEDGEPVDVAQVDLIR